MEILNFKLSKRQILPKLKLFSLIKKSSAGTTLIEVVAVILIIAILSLIIISDFPKIMRQFAVSRAVYKLSQDIRRAEDMGMSGVRIEEATNSPRGGYGIYFNTLDNRQYIIYADDSSETPNYVYDPGVSGDSIVETIFIADQQSGVYIKEIKINGINANFASINFTPPNPTIRINGISTNHPSIEITIGSTVDPDLERIVAVNSAGLVEVK